MTTRTNVGKSSSNPSMTVHPVTDGEKPLAEQEVMAHVPGDPVPVPGQGQGPAVSGQPVPQGPNSGPVSGAQGATTSADPDVAAILQARSEVVTLRTTLQSSLGTPVPGQVLRVNVSKGLLGPTILQMARVLTEHPDILPRVTPASLEAGVAHADALQQLEGAVSDLLVVIQNGRRAVLGATWQDTRDAYRTAARDAMRDQVLAQQIEPVRAVFRKTPQAVTAPMAAADQTRKAANAAGRAGKAASRATAAQQRAAHLNPPAPQPQGVDQGPSR